MDISDTIYAFFADYIYKNSGIIYEPKDFYRLDARIKDLMKKFELATPEELHKKFRGSVSTEMHSALIDIGTNNETSFFRDKKPFKILNELIIPEVLKGKVVKNLKLWSAASSFGQEVYSLIMSLEEKSPGVSFSIDGSDISTEAIVHAKAGTYDTLQVQRGLPVGLLMKYFDQGENSSWTIKSRYGSKAFFKNLNLLLDPFPRNTYDIIFCRNVLIYFKMEDKEVIINKLYNSLKNGGYLFLGIGEGLIKIKSPFKQRIVEGSPIFYKEE